jgi:predicted transcriptional regulator
MHGIISELYRNGGAIGGYFDWEREEIHHIWPDKVITYNISPHMETIMISPKAEVASMLEALSDDVSFEDIQYHLYVLEKVKRGLDRADTDGTIPHEEAKKRLHKWLAD